MELDKRIKTNKIPLTCFDIDEAKKFIGKDCYFSLFIEDFENLDYLTKERLVDVYDNPKPFNYDYRFIIPCEWVEDLNDVENLKKTVEELRQKVDEQEKTIRSLKEYNKIYEPKMNDRWVNLLKLIRDVSAEL